MADPLAFHLELRVQELERSVHFYRHLLAVEPHAVVGGEYALFEVWNLQLLLLVGEGAAVRFGFRLADAAELVGYEARWQAAGLTFVRREFAHPTLGMTEIADNFHDPDGHRCSFYVLTRCG